MARLALTCLLTCLVWGLHPLDVPPGVVAVLPGSDRPSEECGAAVLIDAQGTALTLDEVVGEDRTQVVVVLPGGQRRPATVEQRAQTVKAVRLRIAWQPGDPIRPLVCARSDRLQVGVPVWTVGNAFGGLVSDGLAHCSRGVVSGLYAISEAETGQRGRGGQLLSRYFGPVIETDAAINDGDQGAALVDSAGQLLGLTSLGVAPQRRLGTAVPLAQILAGLGLPAATRDPHPGDDPAAVALAQAATAVANGLVLIYVERPAGPGNPPGLVQPPPIDPALPEYLKKRQQHAWEGYYHHRQMLYTDQPVCGLVIDPAGGLILTALSNLHGRGGPMRTGRVLLGGGTQVPCELLASDQQLDLALLKAAKPLDLPAVPLAADPGLRCGDRVAVVGRHGLDMPATMTTGIVSAVDRRTAQVEHPLHQTDAAVNYGSLGGAVVDVAGACVGLVVMLGPRPDDWPWLLNSGVGIFVDSATIQAVLPELRQGKVRPAGRILGLGIVVGPNLQVQSVQPGTGAAGVLQVGDRLLTIDGQPLHDHDDLSRRLIRHRVGDSVELTVQRQQEEVKLRVPLTVFAATLPGP